jgi:ATP-binding cassette subfamily B protein
MEHGDIVEQGTHEQLIRAEGAYFRLYNSQFEQAASDLDQEFAGMQGDPLAEEAREIAERDEPDAAVVD